VVVDGRNGRIRRRKVFGCLGVVASLNDVSTDGADEWAGPVPLQHGERSEATAVRPLPGKRQ
jgi:hypothetical protein